MTTKMPIVSVFFESDIRLQVLQAMSIDRLFDLDGVTEYILIANSDESGTLINDFTSLSRRSLSRELWGRIRFATWQNYFDEKDKVGRYNQQVLKLAVSSDVDTEDYLVLDAKNHFVRKSDMSVFHANGTRLSHLTPISPYWQRVLDPSFRALGLDPELAQGKMMPSITPYVMNTKLTRDLINDLQDRSGAPLPRALSESGGATEFLLYYAYLIKTGNRDLYSLGKLPVNTLFTIWPQEEKIIQAKIEECANGQVPLFGLHRNRIPQLSTESRDLIESMWRKSILSPWEDARWFLN